MSAITSAPVKTMKKKITDADRARRHGCSTKTIQRMRKDEVDLDDERAVGNWMASRRGGGRPPAPRPVIQKPKTEAKAKESPIGGKMPEGELFTLEDRFCDDEDFKGMVTNDRRVIDLLIASGRLSEVDYARASDIVEHLEAEWALRDHAFYHEDSGDSYCPGLALMNVPLTQLGERLGVEPHLLSVNFLG
jgi:hypothetical protein